MPAHVESTPRSTGNATRDALILSGERLFAERGIGGPSIRELLAAAGVGNKSALHYHFGNREGLVSAIVAGHGETLRVRRSLAFEPVVLDDAAARIERLCDVVVGPYCEFLADGAREWRYLVISAEVLADPTRPYEDLQVLFNDPLLPRIVKLLLDRLDLPDRLATERLVIGISQVISAVATRARQQLFGDGVRDNTPLEVFVANLVDMLVGSITAPVSPATLAAMEVAATGATPR
jgi:AcrR family transcriptional regulator